MDHHATTPVDARVLEAMLPYFKEDFGNAASRSHAYGWRAEEAVEAGRAAVARLIGASRPEHEIVFTSGGTESDNLAIKGVARANRDRGNHIITSCIEHKAVLDSVRRLESEGFRVTVLGVDRDGRVDPEAVKAAIEDDTILVSIMLANNEVGTVQPIAEIGELTRARSVLFHCDAAQGLGYVPFDVNAMQVDLATIVSHKMYGPKGVGALYVRRSGGIHARLLAEMDGGGHEHGSRSGTLNVPSIVGFGEAARIMMEDGKAEAERIAGLRDRLRRRITEGVPFVHLNGPEEWRHPSNLNVSFEYIDGEGLLLALQKKVAVSSGSACTSAGSEPSYVLTGMGRTRELADASIRFGLGRSTTVEQVDRVGRLVTRKVEQLRESNELWRLKQRGIEAADLEW